MNKKTIAPKFSRIELTNDEIVLRKEKDIIGNFLEMKKQDSMKEKNYQKLRLTGAQPARFYGLAKFDKKNHANAPCFI